MRKLILPFFIAIHLLAVSCQDKALRYYNLGLDAMKDGEPDTAAAYFRESLAIRNEDPDAHINLGVALFQLGRYDEALESLKEALDYYPEDPVLRFNLGEVYAAMGSPQAARREYELAIILKPDFFEALTAYGKTLLDSGQYDAAEQNLVHAMTIKPSYGKVYIYLGQLYVETGKYHQAVNYLYRGLKSDPGSVDGRLALADAFYKRGLFEQAMSEYQKVYAKHDTNAESVLGIALCSIEMDKIPQAEKLLKRAVEMKRQFPQAYKVLGDLYLRDERYTAAAANYRMAIQQQEDYPEAHINLARVLLATGQVAEAKEAFDSVLYRSPTDPGTLYEIGQFYIEMNDIEQARIYLEKSLEYANGNPDLKAAVLRSLNSLKKD